MDSQARRLISLKFSIQEVYYLAFLKDSHTKWLVSIETFFLQTVDLVNTVTKAQIDNK